MTSFVDFRVRPPNTSILVRINVCQSSRLITISSIPCYIVATSYNYTALYLFYIQRPFGIYHFTNQQWNECRLRLDFYHGRLSLCIALSINTRLNRFNFCRTKEVWSVLSPSRRAMILFAYEVPNASNGTCTVQGYPS